MSAHTGTAPAAEREATRSRGWLMLALATAGFALCFWAWPLLSPLGPYFKTTLHLSSLSQALLVAVPVVVGSLGRIPVGALTDRYGGRVMFPAVSFATIAPVLFIGFVGYRSLAMLLAAGFCLGIAGTAISALTTVKLVSAYGIRGPFTLVAVALAGYGIAAALLLRDAPGRAVPTEPVLRRIGRASRLSITWQASALYAIGFGGFVAFSVYLPTYLKNAYALTQSDAANKMGGFVLVAVLLRPVGGYLADRIPAAWVLAVAFAVVAVTALGQAATPSLAPAGTVTFLTMAAALGAAAGAVFALVAQRAPRPQVGAVTGVVGAAGGLGGFIPPLIMGSIYGSLHSYALGLIALSVVAAAAAAYAAVGLRAPHSAVGP